MHKIERMIKPTTYCKYKSMKLQLLRTVYTDISVQSEGAGCRTKTVRSVGIDPSTRTTFLPFPWYKKRYNFQQRCISCINSSNQDNIIIQKRHCSRCTLIDGKIPENFRSSPPWRVLFFGTDQFAVFTLKRLNENRLQTTESVVDNIEVVSNKGQTPVRSYAEGAGLLVHDWPFVPSHDRYDVGVLVSFGRLIPGKVIHKFPYGILNVHPSLLPRWRGASPIIHTILNGDTETGISIMEIRPKHFDIGPLLVQDRVPVPPNCSSLQLHDLLGPIGAEMLVKTLYNLPTLERFEVAQPEKGVTYAHKLSPCMAYIDWENQTADSISRQYRAMHEMIPLRSQFGHHHVKLKDMVLDTDTIDKKLLPHEIFVNKQIRAGTPYYSKHNKICWIKCKDGWVGFRSITLKKTMSATSFYNGYLQHSRHKDTLFSSHKNHLMENVYQEKITAFA